MPKFANTFIPDYALGNPDYSPLVITSDRFYAVSEEVVGGHWKDFLETHGDEGDTLDDFYAYLKEKGYGVYTHPHLPIILSFPRKE